MNRILRQTKNRKAAGFTLIELLVVIAVIGILASVVLAALSQSRDKANISKIQQILSSLRPYAENFRLSNGNVFGATLCTNPNGLLNYVSSVNSIFTNNGPVGGNGTAQVTTPNGSRTVCHSNADQWVVSTPIRFSGTPGSTAATSFWCVDSTGASKEHTSVIPASSPAQFVCPGI